MALRFGLCLGDSITDGIGNLNDNDATPNVLARLLRERFSQPEGGIGYRPAYANEAVQTGTAADNNAFGYGFKQTILNTTSDSVTMPVEGTSCRLYYQATTSFPGTFTAEFVGSADPALRTVTCAGQGNVGEAYVEMLIPPGATGLKCTFASETNPRVNGVLCFNGDEADGWHVVNAGHTGFYTNSFYGAGGLAKVQQWVTDLDPEFVTINTGTNEYVFSTAVATYNTNMRGLIDGLLATKPTLKIGLIKCWQHGTFVGSPAWSEYIIAQEYDEVTLIDLYDSDFPQPVNQASSGTIDYFEDNVHPNVNGAALAAQYMLDALYPASAATYAAQAALDATPHIPNLKHDFFSDPDPHGGVAADLIDGRAAVGKIVASSAGMF
jgi:lysophospholipase L1-like esterase